MLFASPFDALRPLRLHRLAALLLLALACLNAAEQLSATETLRVVAFGDSTTAPRSTVEKVYADRLGPMLAERDIAATVFNEGVGGSHTGYFKDNELHRRQHALDRFDEKVLKRQPHLTIVQFGWNDAWVDGDDPSAASRIPLESYVANLTWMVERLLQDGSEVILMTPNRPRRGMDARRLERIEKYVDGVRRIATLHQVPCVDVWQMYEQYGEQHPDKYDALLVDSLHPGDAGHELVAAALTETIVRMVEDEDLPPALNAGPRVADDAEIVLIDGGQAPGVHLDASDWTAEQDYVQGTGVQNWLPLKHRITGGDFVLRAELQMENQEASAASFVVDESHVGFEGARANELFVGGPLFSGYHSLGPSADVFERGAWIEFEFIRTGNQLSVKINGRPVYATRYAFDDMYRIAFNPHRSTMRIRRLTIQGNTRPILAPQPAAYTIPLLDLADDTSRQTVVDREEGQYLGHPTTVLLEDGRTILTVYPKGHGAGAIVMKRSADGGKTWSGRLPTPESWATSREVPTLHRVVDADGVKRLIMFSGLYPVRMAVSEDDGATWSELERVGDWGGIVTMGCVVPLKTPGHYAALFHDDGRFLRGGRGDRAGSPAGKTTRFKLLQSNSTDGGLTWSEPRIIATHPTAHLCEPGVIRSPDGKQLAVLLRENSRRHNSFVIFSEDEGATWSDPRELPAALTGDRHTGQYAPDGRLFISFRDTTRQSPTKGDWVAWVGTYEDIVAGREGQYRVRLMDNKKGGDCAYPGVEVLPDGTFVTTTYGHWEKGKAPFVVSVRVKLEELDKLAEE